MKTVIVYLAMALMPTFVAAAPASSQHVHASERLALPDDPSPPDSVRNRALEEMLSQFQQKPETTKLPYESWTFTAHRFLGYAIVAATVTQIILGSITWDARKAGEEPGTKTAHKYIGYATAGLSLAQSSLGYTNFWKLREKESGKTKRIVHLGMSTLATAGFVTAAAMAYNARQDINDGTAAAEGKTFDDLYSKHRTAGIVSGVSVLLTVAVIEW
jgi:hypothetical protein